jgi:hypothetical protein
MLKNNYIKLLRFTLLRNFILSKVDICKENYVKNDLIIIEKNGILENDNKFYDEYICSYNSYNDDLVYLDKNEYMEVITQEKNLRLFRKINDECRESLKNIEIKP